MTDQCLPPAGTPAGTVCVLRNGDVFGRTIGFVRWSKGEDEGWDRLPDGEPFDVDCSGGLQIKIITVSHAAGIGPVVEYATRTLVPDQTNARWRKRFARASAVRRRIRRNGLVRVAGESDG